MPKSGDTVLKILLNGEPFNTDAMTLEQLCKEAGFSDTKIATAVNGNFVPKNMRNNTALSENDKIEILAPRQGG